MLAEQRRLEEDAGRTVNWKRWGPYLSERQWGTVREDYSHGGSSWDYFPHDHARSRAYRWGEDGLLGITDRQGRLCFALALWNESDPILEERLFGLGGNEGSHGEDVKECYYYLDSTPTHSYMKALYRYPQSAFPYALLVDETRRRTRSDPEYEVIDTGVFDGGRYFDVVVEYAKGGPNDVLVRITARNLGGEPAPLHVLPTLWFRNTWSWGRVGQEGHWSKPALTRRDDGRVSAEHESLGRFVFAADDAAGTPPALLFTENETNARRLFGSPNAGSFVKDGIGERVVGGRDGATDDRRGTKVTAHYRLVLPAGAEATLKLRISAEGEAPEGPFGSEFDEVFRSRLAEADEFYEELLSGIPGEEERRIARQGNAGLLWSKQFYHFSVKQWLEGDPGLPPPPAGRAEGRNHDWDHLYNRDVISMPDKSTKP